MPSRDAPATLAWDETFPQICSLIKAKWLRAMRPAWCVVAIGILALSIPCATGSFKITSWSSVLQATLSVAAFLAAAAYLHRLDHHRIALALEAAALFNATVVVGLPLESVLASAALPFQDHALVEADRTMGIDWVALAFWFREHPAFTLALCYAYASIGWQPMLLIPVLAWASPERLRRVMTTCAVVLAITMVVFLVAPAIGPYEYFHFKAADFPAVRVSAAWVAPPITESLRNGLHEFYFAGLVTFPSYHAVTALLFGFGWLAVPFLRWVFVPLNLLMLISCVPIGSHYVIDVVVGAALVLLCYPAISRYYDKTDRYQPLLPSNAAPLNAKWLLDGLARRGWNRPKLKSESI